MAAGEEARPGSSRNIFDLLQVGVDDAGDHVDQVRAIDREEDDADADQYSEGEMSDEDEFVPFSDDSDDDSRSSDSSEEESIDPNLNSSISEELVDGTVVRTRSYYGKDGTEWKSTPMAPNAQTTTTRSNIVTLPRNCIPNTHNDTSPAETFDLFISRDTRHRRQETDKLAPITEVLDLHLANLQKYYVPEASLTVDEQLIPFRWRCSFIQYIPSKPAKYGLKLIWICDSESYYPLKCIMYTGAMSRIPRVSGQSQGHAELKEL